MSSTPATDWYQDDDQHDDQHDECDLCGGEGGFAMCQEDCCQIVGGEEACTDPACWRRCDQCGGSGSL